jgi:hypothetical protein
MLGLDASISIQSLHLAVPRGSSGSVPTVLQALADLAGPDEVVPLIRVFLERTRCLIGASRHERLIDLQTQLA